MLHKSFGEEMFPNIQLNSCAMQSSCSERSAQSLLAVWLSHLLLIFSFSSCPDAAACPAHKSSHSPTAPALGTASPSLPSQLQQDKWPQHGGTHQTQRNHAAARMLLASGSTAWDMSQGIPSQGSQGLVLPNKKHISIIVVAAHLLLLCCPHANLSSR